MNNLLKQICEHKLQEVASLRARVGFKLVRETAENNADKPRGFINGILAKNKSGKPAIIAEVKKKSPSKGIIRHNFDHVEIAKSYQNAGAACVSVLTDEKYFAGHNDFLTDVRANISLPAIRKDFMLEPIQIYESRALGADCILLIIAALEKQKALELEEIAHSLGMDVLIEVHDETELETALQMKSKLIGVNNRNLKTMEVSLETGKRLSKLMPEGYIKVCESGISTNAEIKDMMANGFVSFLVGESLMREENIEMALKGLIS